MASDEAPINEEYGFIGVQSITQQRESPSGYAEIERTAPDHRRFAIALKELPALTFYNPLLNNPSSSEYVASVRSSLRSLDRFSAGHHTAKTACPSASHNHQQQQRGASMTSLNYMSARAFWSQAKDRSLESNNMDSKRPSPSASSSSAHTKHPCKNKTLIVFCVALLTLVLLGVACLVYFLAGKQFHVANSPDDTSSIHFVYGEFKLSNFTDYVMNATIEEQTDSRNPIFNEIAEQLQHKMDSVYQSSVFLSGLYNRSTIIGMMSDKNSSDPIVSIQFQIFLNHADTMVAEKMAFAFANSLHNKEKSLFKHLTVNLTSIKFTESSGPHVMKLVSSASQKATWSAWSEWGPDCHSNTCDPLQTQTRTRRCIIVSADDPQQETAILKTDVSNSNAVLTQEKDDVPSPCADNSTASAAGVEVRKCHCVTPAARTSRPRVQFSVVRPTKKATRFRYSNVSIATFDEACRHCRPGEVCIARVEEAVPVCRWAPDPEDQSGCGGFCRLNTEVCIPIGNRSFRCEERSECLSDSEWRCKDGLCIHATKRCDGDYNCFDQSDEHDCGSRADKKDDAIPEG